MQYDQTWAENAACLSYSPKVFFREEGSRNEPWAPAMARRVCGGCPVRRQCLEYALTMERAGAIELGNATVIRSDWEPAHLSTCSESCRSMKHWRKRSDRVSFETRPFTASLTPPVGIWAGFTAEERHAKQIKHAVLDDDGDCIIPMCKGCKPIDQWVTELLEAS